MINFFLHQDLLGQILCLSPFLFVPVTLLVGTTGGYYDTDAYDGHGTAHKVQLEQDRCDRMETADAHKVCHLPE